MIRSNRRMILIAAVLALFGAACGSSDFPLIAVQVEPICAAVASGGSQQFDARIFIDDADQGINNGAVVWTVLGGDVNGIVDSNGFYTAPNTLPPPAAQVAIIATSKEDIQKQGQATAVLTGACPAVPPPTVQF